MSQHFFFESPLKMNSIWLIVKISIFKYNSLLRPCAIHVAIEATAVASQTLRVYWITIIVLFSSIRVLVFILALIWLRLITDSNRKGNMQELSSVTAIGSWVQDWGVFGAAGPFQYGETSRSFHTWISSHTSLLRSCVKVTKKNSLSFWNIIVIIVVIIVLVIIAIACNYWPLLSKGYKMWGLEKLEKDEISVLKYQGDKFRPILNIMVFSITTNGDTTQLLMDVICPAYENCHDLLLTLLCQC